MDQTQGKSTGIRNKGLTIALVLIVVAVVGPLSYVLKQKAPDYILESYRMEPDVFAAKVNAMVRQYSIRRQGNRAVVHPPQDSDVYIPAKMYDWGPIIELERGKSYRLHVAALDVKHGIEIRELGILKRLKPGKVKKFIITPAKAGEYRIVCKVFCGPKHHEMVGKLIVTK